MSPPVPAAFRSPHPLVFAHRGGSALMPENTLPAFDRGLACGADGLELDVHLSRDGRVVVHHDATLDRTTGAGGPLAALTAEELAQVDAAHHFGASTNWPLRGQGIGVPTLAEVLHRYPDIPVIIELKVDGPALADAAIRTVRAAGALDRVCVGSFFSSALAAVRRLEPHLATSASLDEVRRALMFARLGLPHFGAPYRFFQVPETFAQIPVATRGFIRAAHRGDRFVQVWTVDETDAVVRLLDWGADAVISDRPDVAVQARDAWLARSTSRL